MSNLIVEVKRIESVTPHPNADRLELCAIGGWQCVIPKGKFAAGQLVTYIPPDSIVPVELSDRLGVTKYLSKGRVRCAKLRGEPSFGLAMELEDPAWTEGYDVREHYGITKYEPPIRLDAGDAEPEHPLFWRYTDIENMRHFPALIADGEEVVATEKIHGTNSRIGIFRDESGEVVKVAGSKQNQRKDPGEGGTYWFPWRVVGVRALMEDLISIGHHQAILFGEIYGKVQSLRYGVKGLAYRVFDLLVDGKFWNHDDLACLCGTYGVEMVPVVYRGPFNLDTIRKLSDGPSLMPGADHIREGVVVKPVVERHDPKIGRVILKYVGDAYLLGDESDSAEV